MDRGGRCKGGCGRGGWPHPRRAERAQRIPPAEPSGDRPPPDEMHHRRATAPHPPLFPRSRAGLSPSSPGSTGIGIVTHTEPSSPARARHLRAEGKGIQRLFDGWRGEWVPFPRFARRGRRRWVGHELPEVGRGADGRRNLGVEAPCTGSLSRHRSRTELPRREQLRALHAQRLGGEEGLQVEASFVGEPGQFGEG